MRTIQYVRAGCLISLAAGCILMAGSARADVSTERPGSLLIFPKVVQAAGRETIVQITNTGNSVDNLHCFYINGQDGPNGHPLCAVTDFFISLTKQQPTHWDISTGRPVDASDSITGFDPGLIPPVAPGFKGALVCAEVDADSTPVAMNKLKGEATLEGPNGDVSKYNALAVQGKDPGDDNLLSLNPNGVEYNGCNTASIFNFIPDGAPDPVIEALGDGGRCAGGGRNGLPCNNNGDCPGTNTCTKGLSRVLSAITALPCNLDFQTQVPTQFSLGYLVIDGNEVTTTTSSGPLECWASIPLSDISQAVSNTNGGPLVGPFASIRVTGATGGPVLLVGESFHVDADGNMAAAAVNLHTTGLCQATGTQAPTLKQTCLTTADCPNVCTGGTRAGLACGVAGDCPGTGGGTCAPSTCVSSQSSTIKLPTLP